jgi:hypothetical protein
MHLFLLSLAFINYCYISVKYLISGIRVNKSLFLAVSTYASQVCMKQLLHLWQNSNRVDVCTIQCISYILSMYDTQNLIVNFSHLHFYSLVLQR